MPARRTALILRLLLVASTAVAVGAGAMDRAAGPPASPAYTMTSTLTVTPPGGAARLVATHVRRRRQDGLFAVATTYHGEGGAPDQSVTLFGADGIGSFALDEGRGRLVFRGPLPAVPQGDVARDLRADPRYVRDEAVAGVNTLVLREPDREGGGFTEAYHAPALAGLVLKHVRESAEGREVFETTSVEPGAPDPVGFDGWRHAADYGHYLRRIERERGRGRPHEADRMAAELERARGFKP